MSRKRIPALKASKRETRPNPADVELFHRSVADATPLPERNKALVKLPLAKPRVRSPIRQHATGDDLSDHRPYTRAPGEPLDFSRPGIQRQALRQLRRGGSAIQDELDLHGLTVAAARPLLVAFLDACARKGLRRVRIIHGRGLRSPSGEGVLKAMVASWLAQREDVLAFQEARASEGGSGAVVVLLRSVR